MPGRMCWGLDVNTSQKQTPTLMYRAPQTPFVEITVCCMATLNPIRKRFSFLSCGFAASADYSFTRSGELLFLFTAAHMLEATRFSIKSPCFFIASLFSVREWDANTSFNLPFIFWPLSLIHTFISAAIYMPLLQHPLQMHSGTLLK